jgi:hypothetical protein
VVWEGRGCEAFPYPDYKAALVRIAPDGHSN